MAEKRFAAVILVVIVVLSSLLFVFKFRNEMADFEVNYKAGQRLRDGETLYRTADGHWQFKYLPFSAFLYLPLTLLSLSSAKAVWFGVIVLATVMIIVISSQLIDFKYNAFISPAFFATLILARYFLRELQLGQINVLITFLLVGTIWFLSRSSQPSAQAASGASVGLAAALKPYAVVFLPYLALRKKWPALAAGLAILSLAAIAPGLFYGWEGNLAVLGEWKSSLATSTPGLLASQDNVSLLAFFMKRTQDQSLSLVLYIISLTAMGGLILFFLRRGSRVSSPYVLEGFLLLALIPLISPLGWDYTFVSAAPALMLIFRHYDKFRPFWRGFLILNSLVIALSLYDLMGRRLYAAFMSSSVITLAFLALAGYLAYLRIKGHA